MGVVVAFDYPYWLRTFPEFGSSGATPVAEPQATSYFNIATTIHANDGSGPVSSPAIQSDLLNMLTAHVAQLLATPAGAAGPNQGVGRVSDASEGSVHVSLEMPSNMSAAAAWFVQTKYGFMYWQATTVYRQMRYFPNSRNPVNAAFRVM